MGLKFQLHQEVAVPGTLWCVVSCTSGIPSDYRRPLAGREASVVSTEETGSNSPSPDVSLPQHAETSLTRSLWSLLRDSACH